MLYTGLAVIVILLLTNMVLQGQSGDKKKIQKNIEAGRIFLAQNAEREGVIELPSGMQYEILVAGEGDRPASSDKVTTHYHGTLISGKVFDSSVERGMPATFPVNAVIKGWQEALPMMPVGSKWRLYIPYNLAYGTRSTGSIPGGATLIFDVELLGIQY